MSTQPIMQIKEVEAGRRHIQHLFRYAADLPPKLRVKFFDALKQGRHNQPGQPLPRGIQKQIRETLEKMTHNGQPILVSKQQVSNWAKRVERNDFDITDTKQDFSSNSNNATKFRAEETRQVRTELQKRHVKSGDIVAVNGKQISSSSVRRIAKRKFQDEPPLMVSVPKGRKIGGDTAHHNKARLHEAQYWISKGQQFVDGLWFADETKMKFSPQMNRTIDIQWAPRGEAHDANWYDKPAHTAQINLFLAQSINGIEYHKVYNNNMKKVHYTNALKKLRQKVIDNRQDDTKETMTCFVHDNLWGDRQPEEQLDRTFGAGKWTRYPGAPCWKPHATQRTPKRGIPTRQYLKRCHCDFPDGPVKAAYCPKTNLVENTFARLDRILLQNQLIDIDAGRAPWPRHGLTSGEHDRKKFWRGQLERAVDELNQDKGYFQRQYAGFLKRCKMYTSRKSMGKRLNYSKY